MDIGLALCKLKNSKKIKTKQIPIINLKTSIDLNSNRKILKNIQAKNFNTLPSIKIRTIYTLD